MKNANLFLLLNRVDEIEQKIGAGLIEEVLQVAEGELILVDELLKYQVYVLMPVRVMLSRGTNSIHRWEDLEEQIPTGQWEYFERGDRV